MAYNGWTNRETWLVNLWFNPESRDDVRAAREYIEEAYNAITPGVMRDFCDTAAINWDELESHFADAKEVRA